MPRDLTDTILPDQPENYAVRIHRLYDTDVGQTAEFVLRNIIVLVVGTGVGLFLGGALTFVWMALYFSVIGAYSLHVTRAKDRDLVTQRDWHIAVALSSAACTVYTFLPIYLWTLPNPAMNFIGACGMFGMAMLNITRHTFDRALALVDMFVVCGSILVMGALSLQSMYTLPEALLVTAGTVACAAYYGLAHRDGLKLRTQLIANERRSAESAKLQAVGQLTTGIAHDFNNILTVVSGNIELARLAQTKEEQHQSLDEAQIAAERAAILVSQLLAFSRRAQLRPVALNPSQFASAFITTMQRLLPASIILRHHVEAGLGQMRCDRTLLETALLNLVINARDAMNGRGSLSLMFDSHLARPGNPFGLVPGQYVRITLADTGPGIAPDLLDRVTEPFFTTKPIGQGSGLGLAMVKGFSEQSGGALNLSSTHTGTEVSVFLPRMDQTAPILEPAEL